MSSKPKVVVADDEYVISRCISFMLKKEGYDCRAVFDGEAALAAVRADPPDVLILDLDMPRRNGFDVCRDVKGDEVLRCVRILVLTAKGQPLSRDWRLRIPADAFMLKPFDPRALLEAVRNLARPPGEAAEEEEASRDLAFRR